MMLPEVSMAGRHILKLLTVLAGDMPCSSDGCICLRHGATAFSFSHIFNSYGKTHFDVA